jgi:hypothetical protein
MNIKYGNPDPNRVPWMGRLLWVFLHDGTRWKRVVSGGGDERGNRRRRLPDGKYLRAHLFVINKDRIPVFLDSPHAAYERVLDGREFISAEALADVAESVGRSDNPVVQAARKRREARFAGAEEGMKSNLCGLKEALLAEVQKAHSRARKKGLTPPDLTMQPFWDISDLEILAEEGGGRLTL